MVKRPTQFRDTALSGLIQAFGKFARRLMPAAPTDRPVGGPVVFRHYL
jgi:hypothetical protein